MMQLPHLSVPDGDRTKPSEFRVRRFDARWTLFAFGGLTFIMGLWNAGTEIIRPHLPKAEKRNPVMDSDKSRAQFAAQLGMIRGDLWADAALLNGGLDFNSPGNGFSSNPLSIRASERSLTLSPLNSEMWLILALHAFQQGPSGSGENNLNGEKLLEMAYLTGQLNFALLPVRILIAARSNALANKSIQDFVQMDVTTIFTKAPNLKPALLAAYRSCNPTNRPLFRQLIMNTDPTFLNTE